MVYDLIIVGGGPAGISAAIYAARRKVDFLMISMDIGGQMIWSSGVENYPGFHLLTGAELTAKFNLHMKKYNINIKNEEVVDIKKKGNVLSVKTNNETYDTLSLIIASGKKPKKLNVPGEDKYIGRGVSYCAICDSAFFKDKTVAVIGGNNSALDATINLMQYAKKIYILDILKKLQGEDYLKEKCTSNKKVECICEAKVTEIIGDKKVTGLKYIKNNKINSIILDGVFVEIGLTPNTDFAKIVDKNKNGEIKIRRSTQTYDENETNIPGIFAAGDVTDVPAKQIVIAAGEGAKAALACFNYINKMKKN